MRKIVGDKNRLIGYRSVNVGDKKWINRLSVDKVLTLLSRGFTRQTLVALLSFLNGRFEKQDNW